MVGNMSRVTLNSDLSKISFMHFYSQGQDLYSHQKLNMYIYWFSSESNDNGEKWTRKDISF